MSRRKVKKKRSSSARPKEIVGNPTGPRGFAASQVGDSTDATNPNLRAMDDSSLLQRGRLLFDGGRIREAKQVFDQLIRINPRHALGHIGAGRCASMLGRAEEGIKHVRRAVEIDATNINHLSQLADFLHAGLHFEESIEVAERIRKLNPKQTAATALIAQNLEKLQRLDDAVEMVDEALSQNPDDDNLLLMSAHLESRRKNYDRAMATLRRLHDRDHLVATTRIQVLNEMGMALDRMGQYDEAFDAFTKCGELSAGTHSGKSTDEEAKYRQMRAYRSGFTAEGIRRFTSEKLAGTLRAPAFLVGFPRSGTTMTEQILAAHPDIETSGERPYFGAVGQELARLIPGPADVESTLRRLHVAGARKLRKAYWMAAERQIGPSVRDVPIFVDKLPLNIIGLGLINVTFPEARVLVALRDPRDVCLSCFFQNFALNNSMVQFLTWEGTARFYEAVLDLYLYYREILSLSMIEVRYEDTVNNLEAQARRILEHFGATWSDDVISFHEKAKEHAIGTPSYAAVTEKIYTRSVQRWKNYEKHFEPILPHLDRFIHEFGYAS